MLLAPIATSGNNVYVVWPSNKTGQFEIMFRASTDGGRTFGNKIMLSSSLPGVDSLDPQIAANGNRVYITWWQNYRNGGTKEPVFIFSEDNGRTFGKIIRLSNITSDNTIGSAS